MTFWIIYTIGYILAVALGILIDKRIDNVRIGVTVGGLIAILLWSLLSWAYAIAAIIYICLKTVDLSEFLNKRLF